MSRWADRYVSKAKKENISDEERLRTARVLREQVVAQAPQVWDSRSRSLLDHVKEVEAQFPNHLKIQQLHGEGLGISQTVKIASPTQQLEVSFYDGAPKIELETRYLRGLPGTKIIIFSFQVSNGGVELVPNDFSHQFMTPEMAAEHILEFLER